MLRAARLLLLQQRAALGAATAGQARLVQQQPQLHIWRTAVAPMVAVRLRSSLFATKAAREQEEEEGAGDGGGGGGSSKNKKRTLKQRLKEVRDRLGLHIPHIQLIDRHSDPWVPPHPSNHNRRRSTHACTSTWSGWAWAPTARDARPRVSGGGDSG